MSEEKRTSRTWKGRARRTLTEPRILIERIIMKRFLPINWNWHFGLRATGWDTWSARWTLRSWLISATWFGTSAGSLERMRLMALWKRAYFTNFSRRDTRIILL